MKLLVKSSINFQSSSISSLTIDKPPPPSIMPIPSLTSSSSSLSSNSSSVSTRHLKENFLKFIQSFRRSCDHKILVTDLLMNGRTGGKCRRMLRTCKKDAENQKTLFYYTYEFLSKGASLRITGAKIKVKS